MSEFLVTDGIPDDLVSLGATLAARPYARRGVPMRDEVVRVVLVDDHAIVRAGLRLLLDAEPNLTVVGEAGDGDEAIAKALELAPDVVLLDVMMPNTNGLDAARRISRETSCRILMLSMQDDPGYVRRAFASGASGYLLKEVAHSQLVSAVRCVAAGGEHLD